MPDDPQLSRPWGKGPSVPRADQTGEVLAYSNASLLGRPSDPLHHPLISAPRTDSGNPRETAARPIARHRIEGRTHTDLGSAARVQGHLPIQPHRTAETARPTERVLTRDEIAADAAIAADRETRALRRRAILERSNPIDRHTLETIGADLAELPSSDWTSPWVARQYMKLSGDQAAELAMAEASVVGALIRLVIRHNVLPADVVRAEFARLENEAHSAGAMARATAFKAARQIAHTVAAELAEADTAGDAA